LPLLLFISRARKETEGGWQSLLGVVDLAPCLQSKWPVAKMLEKKDSFSSYTWWVVTLIEDSDTVEL
jgi:hypothetical protein